MTANQNAANANLISQGVLEETTRHNKVTEELNQKLYEVEKFKAEQDAAYKQRANEIQANYNSWYETYMNSTGKQKDEAKAMLDMANAELADVESYYKTVMLEADRDLRQTQAKLNNAEANYKDFMQGIERRKVAVSEMNALYNAYSVDNTIRLGFAQFNMDSYIKQAQLGLQAKKLNQEYRIQLGTLFNERQKLSLNRDQFNYFKEYNNKLVENTLKDSRNARFNRTWDSFTPNVSFRFGLNDLFMLGGR